VLLLCWLLMVSLSCIIESSFDRRLERRNFHFSCTILYRNQIFEMTMLLVIINYRLTVNA